LGYCDIYFVLSPHRNAKRSVATFVLRKNYLSKLKAVSYWDRKKIKDVIDEALGNYLKGKRIKRR
jgi:hypothetical protein